MTCKADVLEALIAQGAIERYVTAREIHEDPRLNQLDFSGICHYLRRMHRQRLVSRQGQGNYKYPYSYQVTPKGMQRLQYYLSRGRINDK